MKKLLLALSLLAVLESANAQWHHHGGYYRGGCYGCNWAAPAIIGGVIGYELNRPHYEQPVIIQQPPVYVTPSPATVYVQPAGAMPPPTGYHYQYMIDPATNQTKIVLVPN
jgi:hypothetical protein